MAPFHERLLPAAVALAAAGVRQDAQCIDGALLRLPDAPVERLVEPMLHRWRRLGLRPSSVMARRPVATWRSSGAPPPGVVVRVARPDDVEAMTDLALKEHRYHAVNISSGVSREQPRATSRRIAADSITAPADRNHQQVAEDESGRLVGSIVGTVRSGPTTRSSATCCRRGTGMWG